MRLNSKQTFVVLSAVLVLAVSGCAGGENEIVNDGQPEYPTKPIQVVVPFPAGGFTDSGTRVFSSHLEPILGQSLSVVNKDGAGGVTATAEFINAKPDGYTVEAFIAGPTTSAIAADPSLPYEWDTLVFFGSIASSPRVLIAPVDGDFGTGQELIDQLREDPSQVTWATGSPDGPATYSTLALFNQLDVDRSLTNEVVFNGDGPAANAVAGEHADFSAVNLSTALPLIKAGKVVPLIISGDVEVSSVPGTPVANDLGLDPFILDNWLGLAGPPETPDYIVERWESALKELSTDGDLADQFDQLGLIIDFRTAAELSQMVEERFNTVSSLIETFDTE